jgi:hypothetical protein
MNCIRLYVNKQMSLRLLPPTHTHTHPSPHRPRPVIRDLYLIARGGFDRIFQHFLQLDDITFEHRIAKLAISLKRH